MNRVLSRKEIKEAKEELVKLSADSRERILYEKRKESILNRVSALDTAEKKDMKRANIESAKNFLLLGIDVETISKGTGLTIEEIEEIKNEYNL